MKPTPFDATVDLLAHHLDRAGIPEDRSQEAMSAVREALRSLPGAQWVDVDYLGRLDPVLLGPDADRWLTLYSPGRGASKVEGPQWQQLRLAVEEAMRRALEGLSGPHDVPDPPHEGPLQAGL